MVFWVYTSAYHSIEQSFATPFFQGGIEPFHFQHLYSYSSFFPAFLYWVNFPPTFSEKITILSTPSSPDHWIVFALPRIIVLIIFALVFRPSVYSCDSDHWMYLLDRYRENGESIDTLRESTYIDAGRSIECQPFVCFWNIYCLQHFTIESICSVWDRFSHISGKQDCLFRYWRTAGYCDMGTASFQGKRKCECMVAGFVSRTLCFSFVAFPWICSRILWEENLHLKAFTRFLNWKKKWRRVSPPYPNEHNRLPDFKFRNWSSFIV